MLAFPYNGNITVVVEVLNKVGSVSLASTQVYIDGATDEILKVKFVEKIGLEVRERGKWREGIASISLILQYDLSDDSRAIILETLIHIIIHYNLPTSYTYSTLLISLLRRATTILPLCVSTTPQASIIIKDILVKVINNIATNDNVGLSYSEKLIQLLLLVIHCLTSHWNTVMI